MMKLKPMIVVARKANKQAGRDEYVDALRDGRILRPHTIPSGKVYNRKRMNRDDTRLR
jgi:hypothetical protein